MDKNKLEESFIKIPRGFTKWPYYQNPVVKSVFLDLLINANWTPCKVEDGIIGHGQYATTYERLAEHCGITYDQARHSIQKLIKSKEISCYHKKNYMIFTIHNYALYGGKYDVCEEQNQKFTNHIPTLSQQIKKDNNIDYSKNIFD